ncbi:MAG TPA: Ig-like domain-containing protein, partial [Gemmatimonadales bacterium]|nr:Ig-like domain-containing protein [Gemmatimonadales bacterium]
AGTELPAPLVIRVTDAAGRGLGGVTVAWIVTDGGGSVKPVITTTGGDGQASTRWTLGTSAGRNRVTAVVSGFGNEEFEARGTSGGGDDDDDRVVRLSFLVQPTDAQRDERLTPAVQVAAVNASGATVPGADGEVEMRLGQNPGDARLRGDRTERLDEGVAMFNDLRVDKEGDGFTLVASIAGLPEVESAPFRIDH